jgi:hypothetical protein
MSTVPDAYDALIALIQTAVQSLEVQVIGGSPTSVTTLAPKIAVVGTVEGTRSAGSQNRIRTTTRNVPFDTAQDEYTIQLFISVSAPGVELVDLVRVADGIFEAVRAAVDANPTLGVAGVYEALPTGQFRFEPQSDPNGRYVTIEFGVDVTARD